MKTKNFTSVTTILTVALILFGCNDSTGPILTNGSNPLAGAYILYYTPVPALITHITMLLRIP
jgi:hypothetical protein